MKTAMTKIFKHPVIPGVRVFWVPARCFRLSNYNWRHSKLLDGIQNDGLIYLDLSPEKLLSPPPSLHVLSPLQSLHRVLPNQVLSRCLPSSHGKRRAALAAAGHYRLCNRRGDAEIETHGHCLIPVTKDPFTLVKSDLHLQQVLTHEC